MGLFGFGKKNEKTSCACGGDCSTKPENARFIVLGACCKKSADTLANVKQALQELGITDEVVNIGDAVEIAKYGVMQTPGFVINGKVVSYGKSLSTADVKKLLEQAGVK